MYCFQHWCCRTLFHPSREDFGHVKMGKNSGDISFLAISTCFLVALIYSTLLQRGIAPIVYRKFQVEKHEDDLRNGDFASNSSGSIHGVLDSNISINSSLTAQLESLLPGSKEREELHGKGIACESAPATDVYVINRAVRIETTTSTIYHTALATNESIIVKAYPKKMDSYAMSMVTAVELVGTGMKEPPPCDVGHDVPALVFSTGGYAGNFYHTYNDVLLPLFLTSHHFESQVQFVATDFLSWWINKFNPLLNELSPFDIIRFDRDDGRVHCFPGAVLGLKYYSDLRVNSSDTPNGYSILDFKQFLRISMSLPNDNVVPALNSTSKPILVLISRKRSRVFLNEADIMNEARSLGFKVLLALPQEMLNTNKFAELVNSCSVLVGAHGAGMTNLLFLRSGSVLIQVVPLGLDWAASTYYGEPTEEMNIYYREYRITPEESSLSEQYPPGDPVLTDPDSINRQGYNFTKSIYIDGQNIKLDVVRFRETLVDAMQLLQPS